MKDSQQSAAYDVSVCTKVARCWSISPRDLVQDMAAPESNGFGIFDLVTLISALIHVQLGARGPALHAILQLLRPLFYLAFGYGDCPTAFSHEG